MNWKHCWTLAVVASLGFIVELTIFPVQPTDIFLYLAIARETFRTGALPVLEPFLYSIPNYHWTITHEWGTFFIYYGLYKAFDWPGVTLFKSLICTAGFTLPFLRARDREMRSPLLILLALAAAYGASPRFVERGFIITDFFVSLILFIVLREREKPTRLLKFMPLIFLFWVNIHGGFVIGFAVLGWALLERWPQRHEASWRRMAKASLGALIAACVNPKGPLGLVYPFLFLKRNAINAFNMEFVPTFQGLYLTQYETYAFFALIIAALILAWRAGPRRHVFETGLVLLFSAMGLWMNRNVSTVSPALVLLAAELDRSPNLPHLDDIFAGLAAAVVALGIAVGFQGYWTIAGLRHLGFGIDYRLYPYAALQYLNGQGIKNGVYNSYGLGSYLAWLAPEGSRQVFYHSGVEVWDLFVDSIKVARSRSDFDEIVRKYNFGAFIITKHAYEDKLIDLLNHHPNWKLGYEDPAVWVYVKR